MSQLQCGYLGNRPGQLGPKMGWTEKQHIIGLKPTTSVNAFAHPIVGPSYRATVR